MRCRVFTIASVVSLLLCIGTATCWIIAQRFDRVFVRARWTDQPNLVSVRITASGWDKEAVRWGGWSFDFESLSTSALDPVRHDLGTDIGPAGVEVAGWRKKLPPWHLSSPTNVGAGSITYANVIRFSHLVAWLLVLPVCRALVWSLSAWRCARNRQAGQCVTCGYDLTGNVSGVCPECGTAIARKPAT